MTEIKKTIDVQAPIEKVFDYVRNPKNRPEFMPGVFEVRDRKELNSGAYDFAWTNKMAGKRFKGHTENVVFDQDLRIKERSEGEINGVTDWKFSNNNGLTRVTVRAEYRIPKPLLGKVNKHYIKSVNEREVELGLENLKTRMER